MGNRYKFKVLNSFTSLLKQSNDAIQKYHRNCDMFHIICNEKLAKFNTVQASMYAFTILHLCDAFAQC